MSPKRRRVFNPNIQPGIVQSHLENSFAVLPDAPADLKNGHLLYIYKNSEKSRAKTERMLRSHFCLKESGRVTIDVKLHSLVRKTLQKFPRLRNPKEFEKFAMICNETFHLPQASYDTPASKEQHSDLKDPTESPVQNSMGENSGISEVMTSSSISDVSKSSTVVPLDQESEPSKSPVVSARRTEKGFTPREQLLKRRLDYVYTTKAALIQRYKSRIKELKAQLKTPKRVINQTLKRKNQSIKLRNEKILKLKARLRTEAEKVRYEKTKNLKLERAYEKLRKSQYYSGIHHESTLTIEEEHN